MAQGGLRNECTYFAEKKWEFLFYFIYLNMLLFKLHWTFALRERALHSIALVWAMPSVHKHLLPVAGEKGHVRRLAGPRSHTSRQGVRQPFQRWATSPQEEPEQFELCSSSSGPVRCSWTLVCKNYLMFEMWELVALPRASSSFLSSGTRWQQCRRTVHGMDL